MLHCRLVLGREMMLNFLAEKKLGMHQHERVEAQWSEVWEDISEVGLGLGKLLA